MPAASDISRRCIAVLLSLAGLAGAADSSPLSVFCAECHEGGKAKGDVRLDQLPEATLAERIRTRDVLDDALGQVAHREMPTAKAKRQPSAAERAALVDWLQGRIASLDRATPLQAGRVTMRRLNRTEYRATIRDLTGLEFDIRFDPTREFPDDGTGYGFDSIGSALALPSALMERYLTAADEILRQAIVLDGIDGRQSWTLGGEALTFVPSSAAAAASPALGRWSGQVDIPQSGDYQLKVRLSSTVDDPAKEACLAWIIDDQRPADFAWRRSQKSVVSERRLKISDGVHQIGVAYQGERDGKELRPATAATPPVRVEAIEISGPVGISADKLPESHRRIIVVRPSPELPRAEAAKRVLASFARKAFRRPPSAAEIERLLALFAQADGAGISFERTLLAPLSAILVSPHFLFRVEPDRAPDQATNAFALDSHEIASRLSYFLWSSMPDEELRQAADAGSLTAPSAIAAQVKRMLADPKAGALPATFVPQWLQILRVETVVPDPKAAGTLGSDLRRAMLAEPVLLFQHALAGNLPLQELIAPDHTYLNEELAKLYDIPGITDPPYEKGKGNGKNRTLRLTRLDQPVRGGILTMAAVLTATSYPDRTSAVRRGKFVLEAILGATPPPPPPNVTPLAAAKTDAKGVTQTLRQRLEQHRADPTCAGCHARMDPLGFGLENFNPIGRWRDQDGKQRIDASGTLPDGSTFDGPVALKKILMERQDEVARCLIGKLMTYGLGRGMERGDARVIGEIAATNKANGYPLADLVTAICLSVPFRYQGAP